GERLGGPVVSLANARSQDQDTGHCAPPYRAIWEARLVGALAILVLSVSAIDSLNPSTIAPAAVRALGERPARRVVLFTLGVFVASTAGGLVLLFAVGQSVVGRFAHPSP